MLVPSPFALGVEESYYEDQILRRLRYLSPNGCWLRSP